VCHWLDVSNSVGCDLSVRPLQRVWRGVVQQLQRRLHLSGTCLYERDCLAVCCGIIQWQWLVVMWRV
jgi:hypothetical protein